MPTLDKAFYLLLALAAILAGIAGSLYVAERSDALPWGLAASACVFGAVILLAVEHSRTHRWRIPRWHRRYYSGGHHQGNAGTVEAVRLSWQQRFDWLRNRHWPLLFRLKVFSLGRLRLVPGTPTIEHTTQGGITGTAAGTLGSFTGAASGTVTRADSVPHHEMLWILDGAQVLGPICPIDETPLAAHNPGDAALGLPYETARDGDVVGFSAVSKRLFCSECERTYTPTQAVAIGTLREQVRVRYRYRINPQ